MLAYIARRITLLILVMLGVTFMTFMLMNLAPGDPAEMIAIARYGEENLSVEAVEKIRESEGLDSPIFTQYIIWLGHIARGDFGRSLITGDPVLQEISLRAPATLKLALMSMLISLLISIPAGVISALNQNTILDRLSTTGALLGACVPSFWLALLLILLFSVTLGWLPSFGYGGISHIILPSLTLGAGMAAITARLTRSSVLEVLHQDYIITAKSKGLEERQIIFRHCLKNAFIPIITLIGIQLGHLLEGTVIVESIFGWPGIGKLLVESIFARDYAMIQACVLFFAVIVTLINILVDIIYLYLDPRIRYKKVK